MFDSDAHQTERLRYGLNWQQLFIDSMGGNCPKVRLLRAYAKTVGNFMPWSVVGLSLKGICMGK
jgi:hypothetical protein